MTAALLKSDYDQAFPPSVWIIGAADATGAAAPTGTAITALGTTPTTTDYCLVAQNGNYFAWKHGPWRHDQGRHHQEQHLHLIQAAPAPRSTEGARKRPLARWGWNPPIRG